MKRVLIAYKSLPAYRVEFFNGLRQELNQRGIRLDLAFGDPFGAERTKNDSVSLPWALHVPNRFVRIGAKHAIWQPIVREALRSDLVIVEQASRLLINYALLGGDLLRFGPPLAFWGHGRNMQTHTASRLSESAKRRYSTLPHWWFAYTEGSKRTVVDLGYPAERVTVVQNAIDTKGLRQQINSLDQASIQHFLKSHSLRPGATALYMGSLYHDKRLDFLLESARHIAGALPGFSLIVAGDGPLRSLIEEAAIRHEHIKYLGRLDGAQRALALHAADVTLMPGLVGLGVLDAFAAEAPPITTSVNYHSPEIEYLEAGINGLTVSPPDSPEIYAETVLDTLTNTATIERLRDGCRSAAARYTSEAMVQNFANGVQSALEAHR